jgi:hypothetical protein
MGEVSYVAISVSHSEEELTVCASTSQVTCECIVLGLLGFHERLHWSQNTIHRSSVPAETADADRLIENLLRDCAPSLCV